MNEAGQNEGIVKDLSVRVGSGTQSFLACGSVPPEVNATQCFTWEKEQKLGK